MELSDQIRVRLAIRKSVPVYTIPGLEVPAIIGGRKAAVLLPRQGISRRPFCLISWNMNFSIISMRICSGKSSARSARTVGLILCWLRQSGSLTGGVTLFVIWKSAIKMKQSRTESSIFMRCWRGAENFVSSRYLV